MTKSLRKSFKVPVTPGKAKVAVKITRSTPIIEVLKIKEVLMSKRYPAVAMLIGAMRELTVDFRLVKLFFLL